MGQPGRTAAGLWETEGAPAASELGSKGAGLLVEEERGLTVPQEVVVDGGQASAQLHLRLFAAQVHGCRQCQLVVPSRIKGVLWVDRQAEPRVHAKPDQPGPEPVGASQDQYKAPRPP